MARAYPLVVRAGLQGDRGASTFRCTSERFTGHLCRRRPDRSDVKARPTTENLSEGPPWALKERTDRNVAKGLPARLQAKQFVAPEYPKGLETSRY